VPGTVRQGGKEGGSCLTIVTLKNDFNIGAAMSSNHDMTVRAV
jgi:hypothetical protein